MRETRNSVFGTRKLGRPMQTDQAAGLRLLVNDDSADEASPAPRAARTLLVYGAKGGVGTTTVALNLAVSISVLGCAVELASNNALPDEEASGLVGPAGVTLPDSNYWRTALHWGRRRGMKSRDREAATGADCRVIDGGTWDAGVLESYEAKSPRLLLVTTTEPAAVLAAFEGLRQAVELSVQPEIVVNRAASAMSAEECIGRIRTTAQRMFGSEPVIHWLSEDSAVLEAARRGRVVALSHPGCPFSRVVLRLAQRWIATSSAPAA